MSTQEETLYNKTKDAQKLAEAFQDKYPKHMAVYESLRKTANHSNANLSPHEYVALGEQFEQFNGYKNYLESMNNLGALGALPIVALDVITANMGTSIIPLVAFVNPLMEETGLVYYKNTYVMQDGGGYTKGEVIRNPLQLNKVGDGTLGSQNKLAKIATSVTVGTSYTAKVDGPLRPYKLEIDCGICKGRDNGDGHIWGTGLEGTVNYETGEVVIEIQKDPGEGAELIMWYNVDVDSASTLDEIRQKLTSKRVTATQYAIKSPFGIFADWQYMKRFNSSASSEIATDLMNELNEVLNRNMIGTIYNNAVGMTEWDRQPPLGTTLTDHFSTISAQFAAAESVIHANTGQGTVNRIICGNKFASVFASMTGPYNFGFKKVTPNGTATSVYGIYNDDTLVIRATGSIPDDEAVFLCNPNTYWNAPAAYCPYMPIFVTDPVANPQNPLNATRAAGVWAGIETINSALATRFKIKNIDAVETSLTAPTTPPATSTTGTGN